MPGTTFQIGTDYAHLADLSTYGLEDPDPKWSPGAKAIKCGDGKTKWLGNPVIDWLWGFVRRTPRDALRVTLPNESGVCAIRTKQTENSDAFRAYDVTYTWDTAEGQSIVWGDGKRKGFSLRFSDAEEISEP